MNADSIKKTLDSLNFEKAYSLAADEKRDFLLEILKRLTVFHAENCRGYRNFLDVFSSDPSDWVRVEQVPPMPVRLFKMHDLFSIDSGSIAKTLTSSGTSGSNVSKIFLDAETAKRQSRILAAITMNFIGKRRFPMVIVDSSDLLKDRTKLNARAAGILGYSVFGRDHFYCLDKNLEVLAADLSAYLKKYNKGPILIFGFTFVVWQRLLQYALNNGITFDFGDQSILIHGGGWKKLSDQQVDNSEFKALLRKHLGIRRVHNYYGMVEQVGSIFMECSQGYFHCPDYADVFIRNPSTLKNCEIGEEGVLQVLSVLPVSYPGHSLLTEDLGTVHGEDDCLCGRKGKYFSVSGRMAMAELRGCSDTRDI